MKTNKIFNLKIFVLIIILTAAQSSAFTCILGNGAGGGYGEGGSGEGAVHGGNLIEGYIIEGAGHYLEAYSTILYFFNRVELANESSMDFFLWQSILSKSITQMNRAAAAYDLLIREAEAAPYNETVLLKLKNFDYNQFRVDCGLKIEVFREVESYLKNGDITGMFKRIRAGFKDIISRLETVHEEVSQNKIPALKSLWDLNELCSSTLQFGQYVSRVFYKISLR
jgi:hypothetical protein